MNFQPRPHLTTANRHPPFECVALLLQGGGALGAYQGGVYEALTEANIHPDWIAGISIGAINAAIIAGNPPEFACRSAPRVLDAGDIKRAVALVGQSIRRFRPKRRHAQSAQSNERQSGGGVRRGRILFRAPADAVVTSGRHAGIDQLLRYQAAQGTRWSGWWTSIGSTPG